MPPPKPLFKNHILATLPQDDLKLLLPHLQPVELEQKNILYDIGQKFEHVYFLEQGVASVVTTMEDGTRIEAGMVGFEGMTPIAALLGGKISQQHIVIQLSGCAMRMPLNHCMAAFEKSSVFRQKILDFTNSFLHLCAQTAACNRLHSVEQRLVRWLLMTHDRVRTETLQLTQEYIAIMLGVRRVGVNEAAGDLQRSGLIRYSSGNIAIVDRAGLEKAACECYDIDRKRFDSLIASNVR
jgi:CRP-like cAMP-binding protein